MWAKKNLGATAVTGEGSYGNYYAWGGTTGYPLEGNFTDGYTVTHEFSSDTVPGYEVDEDGNLKPEYDAAHVALKGIWRMPAKAEFTALINNTDHPSFDNGSVESGMTFTSKVSGYTDKYVFFPAAGKIQNTSLSDNGSSVRYWASTLENVGDFVRGSCLKAVNNNPDVISDYNFWGIPIRPVFSVE